MFPIKYDWSVRTLDYIKTLFFHETWWRGGSWEKRKHITCWNRSRSRSKSRNTFTLLGRYFIFSENIPTIFLKKQRVLIYFNVSDLVWILMKTDLRVSWWQSSPIDMLRQWRVHLWSIRKDKLSGGPRSGRKRPKRPRPHRASNVLCRDGRTCLKETRLRITWRSDQTVKPGSAEQTRIKILFPQMISGTLSVAAKSASMNCSVKRLWRLKSLGPDDQWMSPLIHGMQY